ncbi:MAG: DUF5666 domain-containing protein [Pseudomonadota bacterium]
MMAFLTRRVALALSMVLTLATVLMPLANGPRAAGGDDQEGGIGGTGIYFGPVTALGSIVVNGERIATPGGVIPGSVVPVAAGGRATPGDTVFVEAGYDNGSPVARRIVRFYPIVGPVSAASTGELRIMGTRVLLRGAVPIVTAGGQSADAVPAGAHVAVNGMWRNNTVIATKIVILNDRRTASISGLTGRSDGRLVVGGTRVSNARVGAGAFVTVTGAADANGLRATSVRRGLQPYAPVDRSARLSATAFLAPDPDGRGYHLSGFGLPMDPRTTLRPRIGSREVFVGTLSKGAFLIEDRR